VTGSATTAGVRAIALLAALAAVGACGGRQVEPRGEITFTVNRAGRNEIWLMREDGSDRRRLTHAAPRNDAAGSMTPARSPDGTKIAFSAKIGTRAEDQRLTEIYVMRVDGTDVRRITTNEDVDADPSWSPDGKRIVFTRITEPGTEAAHGGIFVINAGGGRALQITQSASPTIEVAPAWAPDGSIIAFTRVTVTSDPEQSKVALYVVTPGGSELRKLTDDGGEPDWSPDGERIAFTSARDRFGRTCFEECSPNGEIYVMDADGGYKRRLTKSEANDRSPAWSPDGRFIAFVSDRSNPRMHENEIYEMDADGSDVRRITRNDVWDLDPDW
jgi:TolB protein